MGKVHGQKSPAGTGAQKKGGFERFSVCGAAKGYLPVVDFAKGLAIIGVLLLHFFTETKAQLSGFWLSFHEAGMPVLNLAVPAFVFLMAFNMAYALGIKPRSLVQYFKGRALRLLPAFLVAFFASLFFGILLGLPLNFGMQQAVGYFPVPGAGNYFIPLVFQFAILFPGMLWLYRRSRICSLGLFFALDIIFEAGNIWGFGPAVVVYQYCIARFLALVWIGFFLSEKFSGGSRAVAGLASSLPLKVLALFGIASYHIFLVQIVFFSAIGNAIGFTAADKVLLSLAIGILFYYANKMLLGWGTAKGRDALPGRAAKRWAVQ